MRVRIDIPPPPTWSAAYSVETEESITRLLESLIRRCDLESCGRILPRDRKRFCSDAEKQEYHRYQKKLREAGVN